MCLISIINYTIQQQHMKLINRLLFFTLFLTCIGCFQVEAQNGQSIKQTKGQDTNTLKKKDVTFQSEGIQLAGTVYYPEHSHAAVVLVHGSDRVPRMNEFATLLAQNDFLVLTYDKRGVGDSGGVYAGPEVGTNNISVENLNLLASDASAAINFVRHEHNNLPVGLLGFSQAGWIIPLAANQNPLVQFMVLFSCPTITTLEQLRFQFYTDGNVDFWATHTDEEAEFHTMNDPDRYQFEATDPMDMLKNLSIPGIWLYGEKDIQIPVKMCIADLNSLKKQGKPYEYAFFPSLGHNTGYSASEVPFDISVQWIKRTVNNLPKQ